MTRIHTKTEYNSCMHSLRLKQLKEELELGWKQIFKMMSAKILWEILMISAWLNLALLIAAER